MKLPQEDGWTLEQAQTRARTWLLETAAPFWGTRGVHPDGMFVEAFTRDGRPIDLFRRQRVQARQIYSFCELGRLGWKGPWRDLVANAAGHLTRKGILPDGQFIHRFDGQGKAVDLHPDLYDQAFGLFALAHAGRALSDPALFALAERTLDLLEGSWARSQGGFWEGELTPCPPYRQNPHMHLFEAGMAHYSFTGNVRWKAFCSKIADLFKKRFQHEGGAVTEYFDENWHRLDGAAGHVVEPGHCWEWAWLFESESAPFRDLVASERLLVFARRWGICERRGLAINEVDVNGALIDGRARLWPQAERMKSAVARYRRSGNPDDEVEIVAAYRGLEKYWDPVNPAIWYDKIDQAGRFIDEPSPTSSFYHIVCGISELLNVHVAR